MSGEGGSFLRVSEFFLSYFEDLYLNLTGGEVEVSSDDDIGYCEVVCEC